MSATRPVRRPKRKDGTHRTRYISSVAGLSVALEVVGTLTLVVALILSIALTPGEAIDAVASCYLVGNCALYASVVLNVRRGGISLLIGFFFLFFVALPVAVQVESSVFPFASTYTAAQLVSTFTLFCVAQISYIVGVHLAGHRREAPAGGVRSSRRLSIRFSVVLLLVSAAVVFYIGPSGLFITRMEFTSGFGPDDGLVQQLTFIGRSISLLALLIVGHVVVRSWKKASSSPHEWVLLFVAMCVAFMLNYPPALPRFQLLGAALAVGAIVIDLFRPMIKVIFTAAAAVFLFFLFPAIKIIGVGGRVDIGAAFANDVMAYLVRVDFDAFKQVADTITYLQNHPPRYGENFVGVLLFWVPRSVWPGKPTNTGELVSSSLGRSYTNVSSPLPAEAFISFGYVGVVLVFVLTGLVVAKTEMRVSDTRRGDLVAPIVIFYALFIGFVTIILRGALNSVAPMFMSAFVGYGLFYVLSKMESMRTDRRDRLSAAARVRRNASERPARAGSYSTEPRPASAADGSRDLTT